MERPHLMLLFMYIALLLMQVLNKNQRSLLQRESRYTGYPPCFEKLRRKKVVQALNGCKDWYQNSCSSFESMSFAFIPRMLNGAVHILLAVD